MFPVLQLVLSAYAVFFMKCQTANGHSIPGVIQQYERSSFGKGVGRKKSLNKLSELYDQFASYLSQQTRRI